MTHFQHSLSIAASPAAVYAALSTIAGLRGWWTQDCDGVAEVGATLHFRFGTCYKDMRVERQEPGREVRWLCTRAHVEGEAITRADEWLGTEPVFRLSDAGQGRTRLDFEHIGLVPSFQCYGICCEGWQHFLGSLRAYMETGEGTPYVLVRHPQPQSMERSAAA